MKMVCPTCGSDEVKSAVDTFLIDGIERSVRVTKCKACGFYIANAYWRNPQGGAGYAGWTKYMDAPYFLASNESVRRFIDG